MGEHLRANGPVEAHDDIGRCRPTSVSGNLRNLSNSCRFANCFTKTDEDGDAAFDFQNDETEEGVWRAGGSGLIANVLQRASINVK